jgi:hypothetical protein
MDTKLNGPHDQRSEYLKKSLFLLNGIPEDKGSSSGRYIGRIGIL